MRRLVMACSLLLTGCGLLPGPKIKVPGITVESVKDAGKPAVLNTKDASEALTIPQGSKVIVTQQEALPATDKEPAKPAVTTTEIIPAAPMDWKREEKRVSADTGTVDTSVAKARIAAQERRWLLFVAIACGVGGILARSLLPGWAAVSNGLFLAAVLAGLAWKLAEIPAWIWGVGLIGIALALGYKRAELDKNKDGIPDFLQRNPPEHTS